MWGQDFFDLIEPGHYRFDENGLGYFIFGAVEGQIDYRLSDDGQRFELSWSGNEEGGEKSGRGWFEVISPDTAEGRFYIHCGDESVLEISKLVS